MSSPQFSERSSSMVEMETCVPPGFRFHPTEEELVGYYLKRKINSLKINLEVIVELDLYKMEPWDIQDRCKLGYEEQNEWYFFSHKDKKYPTGTRTNRATAAGFWKATGRDKAVMSKNRIIGMRKTLVFYQGRAPNGRKSDWIMHEYRLQTSEHAPPQEEGWVVCRAFRKPSPNQNHIRQSLEAECYLREQIRHNSRPFSSSSFGDHILNNHTHHHHHHNLIQNNNNLSPLETLIGGLEQHQQLIEVLPQLESPNHQNNNITSHHHHHLVNVNGCFSTSNNNEECFSDVESLDNLFASNLCTDGSTNAFFSHSSSSSNMIINNNMPQYHHQLVQPQNRQPNVHVLGCFPDH